MGDISTGMQIAASGLEAQSGRIRIVAENLANAQSTAQTPGGDPYRRQVPVFSSILDGQISAQTVRLSGVEADRTPFTLEFDPGHPAADDEGYVKLPNVNPLIEMMDLRDAQRSYEANLGALDLMRAMASATLQILE
ncbi:MAG: flagellar basal body rod protein FlgC [Pseudomonadota bacterium]